MKKIIAIFGGGPAGMMTAEVLSKYHDVHIYEKEKAVGQKFLVAGTGGFNITNSLTGQALAEKYIPSNFLAPALSGYGSEAVRNWLDEMGIPTYVGSSGRVFPAKEFTPAAILKIWKLKLTKLGVNIHIKSEFSGFDDNMSPIIKQGRQKLAVEADYCIFAMGGASWRVTGSTGKWINEFGRAGFETVPFQSSNCGVLVPWPDSFTEHHAGKPLKNMSVSAHGISQKGEALITTYGLEGNAVYPVIPGLRKQLAENKPAFVQLDFKPFNSEEQLLQKLNGKTQFTTKKYAEIFNLDPTQLALIKTFTSKETFLSPQLFVKAIKQLEVPVSALRPVEEAISTVGGLSINELNPDFSFRKNNRFYAAGEMIDWDAPTGGFLLQACFTMGYSIGMSILAREKSILEK